MPGPVDQLEFFRTGADGPAEKPDPARLDCRGPLKAALAQAMKASGLSRQQLADKMNDLIRQSGTPARRITGSMLDSWASLSHPGHVPNSFLLPMLCVVLGTTAPIEEIVKPLGLSLAGARERLLQSLGEGLVQSRAAARKRRLALATLEDSGRGQG
ncbi:MAG: hypothetical protein V1806_05915 [Pseudomonadota bacterium]